MKLPTLTTSIKYLREVLARRTAIVAAVSLLLSFAVENGWIGVDFSGNVTNWINKVFILGSLVATVVASRGALTPVADPRDNAGNHLVPAPDPATVVAVGESNREGNIDPNELTLPKL